MKRGKLSLGEKVAVICEGGAETAIMEMLLDAGRLIFTEEDLFYYEIIRCRSAEIFEQRYLKVRMDFRLAIIRVLDSRRENFRLSKPYCDEVDVINVITSGVVTVFCAKMAEKQKKCRNSVDLNERNV